MSKRLISKPAPVPRLGGTFLASVALGALLVAPAALAQTVDGLRLSTKDGGIDSSVLDKNALSDTDGDLTAAPRKSAYVPVSEGAVADDELQDPPLYGETGDASDSTATDLFQLNKRPESPRLPLGAKARGDRNGQVTFDDTPDTAKSDKTGKADDSSTGKSATEATDQTATSGRIASLPDQDEERNTAAQADSIRTGTVDGQTPEADEDPFAAVGIRAGSFILKPSLETGIKATTNVDSAAGGARGILSETTLRLDAASDWLRHAATLSASFAWEQPISPGDKGKPQIYVDGTLRFDLADDYEIDAAAGYSLTRESADSPVAIPATANRPYLHNLTASLAIAKSAGKLRYSLTGDLNRDIYTDAKLVSGGTLSQSFRNNTLATATLRAGYEISPAIVPFAEVEIGRRLYDEKTDPAGYQRSSNRLAIRGGAELDFGDKLSGEIAVGWLREAFDDPTLAAITGISVDGNLVWSPQRGTTVTLAGQTTVEQSTTAGESGSVFHSATLDIEHELRANLTGTASLEAGLRNYSGTSDRDITLAGELGFTWWLNRYAGLTGNVRHERLTSTLSGRSYTANSVFLGLKLQR